MRSHWNSTWGPPLPRFVCDIVSPRHRLDQKPTKDQLTASFPWMDGSGNFVENAPAKDKGLG